MRRLSLSVVVMVMFWALVNGGNGAICQAADADAGPTLEEVRAEIDAIKAEMRAWRKNSFELQKRLVAEDEGLTNLQEEIAAKEELVLRLRQDFSEKLAKHPQMTERRDKQRALAEKLKKAQHTFDSLRRQGGGGE